MPGALEREVIGERVRDKIAASRRKGIWVSGPVPLGYAAIDKKAIVVPMGGRNRSLNDVINGLDAELLHRQWIRRRRPADDRGWRTFKRQPRT